MKFYITYIITVLGDLLQFMQQLGDPSNVKNHKEFLVGNRRKQVFIPCNNVSCHESNVRMF